MGLLLNLALQSVYIFDLPEGTDSGLHVASCLVTKAADDSVVDDKGKAVVRPYTPITAPSEKGRIDRELTFQLYAISLIFRLQS